MEKWIGDRGNSPSQTDRPRPPPRRPIPTGEFGRRGLKAQTRHHQVLALRFPNLIGGIDFGLSANGFRNLSPFVTSNRHVVNQRIHVSFENIGVTPAIKPAAKLPVWLRSLFETSLKVMTNRLDIAFLDIGTLPKVERNIEKGVRISELSKSIYEIMFKWIAGDIGAMRPIIFDIEERMGIAAALRPLQIKMLRRR